MQKSLNVVPTLIDNSALQSCSYSSLTDTSVNATYVNSSLTFTTINSILHNSDSSFPLLLGSPLIIPASFEPATNIHLTACTNYPAISTPVDCFAQTTPLKDSLLIYDIHVEAFLNSITQMETYNISPTTYNTSDIFLSPLISNSVPKISKRAIEFDYLPLGFVIKEMRLSPMLKLHITH